MSTKSRCFIDFFYVIVKKRIYTKIIWATIEKYTAFLGGGNVENPLMSWFIFRHSQRSRPGVFCKKSVLQNFAEIHMKIWL